MPKAKHPCGLQAGSFTRDLLAWFRAGLLLQPIAQLRARDAEQARGAGQIALGARHRGLEQQILERVEREARSCPRIDVNRQQDSPITLVECVPV